MMLPDNHVHLEAGPVSRRRSGKTKGLCASRSKLNRLLWLDVKVCQALFTLLTADNNMINGTKLLNVAQMSRGKRDGILKNESVRHVIKVGSMHLKGVW